MTPVSRVGIRLIYNPRLWYHKKNGKVKIQICSIREGVVDVAREKPVEFTIVTRSISFVV